jgi:hypothetical protein
MTSTGFSIGELVEVLCDHKRNSRRVHDWVEGVVVHADDRMIAIQFRTDVYLTDGWMIPDRILWFNKGSEKLRAKKNRNHPLILKTINPSHKADSHAEKKQMKKRHPPQKIIKKR